MATRRTIHFWPSVLGVLSLWLGACEVTPGTPFYPDLSSADAADLSATAPGDMAAQRTDLETPDLNRPPPDWTKLNPANNPPPANAYCMAYDSNRHRVVLFGGFKQPSPPAYELTDDTWEWDGTNWTRMTPMMKPPGRTHCNMAFDSKRGKAVLFGGSKEPGKLNDTWLWDGTNWTPVSTLTKPSPRTGMQLVYDSNRERIIGFGGDLDGGQTLSETWEFDGTDWVKRTPPLEPSPRYGHAMAYDLAGKRTLLYGGTGDGQTFSTEMWTWDGTQWRPLSLATRPPS